MNLLIILAVVFGILVLIRLADVAKLASMLSGEDEEKEQDRENRINASLMNLFLWVSLTAMVWTIYANKDKMLPVAASEHGVKVDQLMNINWIVLFIVFFITHIALFTFAWKYRHNKNRRAFYYHDNNKLEAIWTIIPTIVLAALIVTGLVEWNKITDKDSQKDGMVVQLYAKQFDFTARYSGPDNKLGASSFRMISDTNPLGVDEKDKNARDDKSARELVLPVNVPVELVMNSRDVIHSMYLPHFRVQMNAVPGMTTRFYFKPTITTEKMKQLTNNEKFEYILLCNKICGVAHYNMKMPVRVVEMNEYKEWLKNEKLVFEGTASGMTASNGTAAVAGTQLN